MMGTVEPIGNPDNPMSFVKGFVAKYGDSKEITKEDIFHYLKSLPDTHTP
jgi:hypothetical protein